MKNFEEHEIEILTFTENDSFAYVVASGETELPVDPVSKDS